MTIGRQTPPVTGLASKLESIFTQLGSQVHVYDTLEQMDENVLDAEAIVASLTELDQPVFKDITPERWYNFKRLFENGRTVLWLTSGRFEGEPYSNMTVGFGRSAVHEQHDLRLQFVDIPEIDQIDARTTAGALVRLDRKELEGEEIFSTVEPEILIDTGGRQLVP